MTKNVKTISLTLKDGEVYHMTEPTRFKSLKIGRDCAIATHGYRVFLDNFNWDGSIRISEDGIKTQGPGGGGGILK